MYKRVSYLIALSLLVIGTQVLAEEPMLPAGLDEPALPTGLSDDLAAEPDLPVGLEMDFESSADESTEPMLPQGLAIGSQDEWQDDSDEWQDEAWQVNGFWEARLGDWRSQQSFLPQHSIAETRLHLNTERAFNHFTVNMVADLLYDDVALERHPRLETGQGWLDLRAANIVFSPLSFMDVRVGRQTLTWGTGDLIFINDLFPKDWNSFLIGRDDAYLKAPSDAVKASLFSDSINLDIVYTPRFDADRYISGERASYYNANLGRTAGTDAVVVVEKPDKWFEDDELALRLYRNVRTYELALYSYNGFWKSPGGANPATGNAIFPGLNVYGASLRGPLLGGIVSGEWGYYDSKEDASGTNPLINNSEQRLLLGYEHELVANVTLAMQFYRTRMLDYTQYQQSLPIGMVMARQKRHEVSARLTWMALNQKLNTSLFLRYSNNENDYYLRPKVSYSMDDHWSFELGANLFHGKQAHTFFGQFERNDNIYVAMRYGFLN
ncbi:hypothetical protein ACFL2V_13275 [Pseudomonadota bacterium]